MRDYVINGSLKIIKNKNPNYDDEKMEILEYGLTGLYILITKTIIIFTIAYFLGILKELIIFTLIYNCIRIFSFGIHATSSSKCLIASTLAFIGSTYLCKLTILPIGFKIVFGLIGIIYIFIHSPADTEKRPIVNPKRRMKFKIISSIIALIMVITSIISNNSFVANSCTVALIMQCIMISPVTYKLTNQQYDNYKYYQPD